MKWDEIDKFISMDYKPKSPNPSEEDVLKAKSRFVKTQGFLTLQNSIDKMIINHKADDEYDDDELYQVFKTKTYLVKNDIVYLLIIYKSLFIFIRMKEFKIQFRH